MKRGERDSCYQMPRNLAMGEEGVEALERFLAAQGGKPPCGMRGGAVPPMRKITAVASNMSNLAESLTMSSMTQLSTTLGGLLVLNRTGLPDSDFFDFAYEFGADPDASQSLGVAQEPAGPTIFEALEKSKIQEFT